LTGFESSRYYSFLRTLLLSHEVFARFDGVVKVEANFGAGVNLKYISGL